MTYRLANDGIGVGVELVQGSFASCREIHPRSRRRLGAATLFLAVISCVLFFWSLFGTSTDHWLVTLMMFLRFAIAAACAGVIVSRISLTAGQVRWTRIRPFRQFHDHHDRHPVHRES